MKQKSLTKNTIVYTLKIMSSALFPLITFPYISRVLLAEGVGVYNFSNSVISYFLLLAGLGISTYAIREGAKIRDNRQEFMEFAGHIYSINIIATGVSLFLLILCICFVPIFSDYRMILIILSVSIPMTTIGTEWVLSIYEDFIFITIRSIVFQFISLILMFVFIRKPSDVWKYAVICVFSSVGANILNYNYVKKYFNHIAKFDKNIVKHMKPILVLFASSLASQIYVNADIIMIGIMQGKYATGLYSASAKIYNIVRLLLTAVITIVLPRLAYLKKQDKESEYVNLLSKTFNGYASIIIPAGIGLLLVSKSAILLLAGTEYVEAVASLQLLSLALIVSTMGSFVANTILIVYGQESKILMATCIGCLLNIVFNFYFIKRFGFTGAAIATLISEVIVFTIQALWARRCVAIKNLLSNLFKIFIGIFVIILGEIMVMTMELPFFLDMIVTVILSGGMYILTMLICKQELFVEYFNKIRRRVKT